MVTVRPLKSETNWQDHKLALQSIQARRMDNTYGDLKSNPEFSRIGRFFFEQIYAPCDFSFRDNGIRKLHSVLKGKVHNGVSGAVSKAFELQELTEKLDDRMVDLMIQNGNGPDLSFDQYRELYRKTGDLDERMQQIRLSLESIREFHRLSRKWGIGVSLKAARSASKVMGIGDIMDFVYEGYQAFREIGDIDAFVATIEERETEFNRSIFNGNKP